VDLGINEEVYITIPRGQSGELQATLNIEETIRAEVAQGQVLGRVEISLGDELLYQGDVSAMQAVERGGLLKRLLDFLTMFFTNLFS